MIIHTIEQVRDLTNPAEPGWRYIVRVPDLHVGFGAGTLTSAYLGCMALALGFDRNDVERMADRYEEAYDALQSFRKERGL